ncbi:FG-GAP-like repeat-containing protein [bacterium]|nr:FG-GAP-like repeat-containing protein [bacterium]
MNRASRLLVPAGWLALLATLLPGLVPPALAQFTDRTVDAGLLSYDLTWSGALSDVDRDGDLDIYAGHHFHPPVLWWNDGDANFDSTAHPQFWSGALDRHGALILSLDSDADPEIVVMHGGQGGEGAEASELYRNDGGGSLVSLLGAGGLADSPGRGRCASAADYNGDNRVDVWVGQATGVSPNRLYRNDFPLFFTELGAAAGLDEYDGTAGGLWGDIDDDGDPDLLVGGEEFPRPTILWRNDGGVFSDASSLFSPPLPVLSGADFGDFDNDGDLDLAACDGQLGIFDAIDPANPVVYFFNTRYAENGVDGLTIASVSDTATAEFRLRGVADTSKVFLGPSEVLAPSGVISLTDDYVGAPTFTPGVDRGTWVWRASPGGPWEIRCSTPLVNLDTFDGWLRQKFLTPSVTPHDLEAANFVSGAPHVWRNDGGSFVEISGTLGLPAFMVNPRDISWVDHDNDGDLDLHVVDKGTSGVPNAADRIFRNDGASFADVTSVEKIGGSTTGLGDGAVWGDMDNDGDLDLYLMEGAGPLFYSAEGPSRFYENTGQRGPSLQLDLVGRQSGGAAVGTKVTAVIGGQTVYRRVQANAWAGLMDPLRIHIGMNGAADVDTLTIEWISGITEIFTDVTPGVWTLTESIPGTDTPEIALPSPASWGVSTLAPQPGRGVQSLRLMASRPVRLEVTVHDVAGRLVRDLTRDTVEDGGTEIRWDGRDAAGTRVPAGVYFLRVSDGERSVTRKSTRLR